MSGSVVIVLSPASFVGGGGSGVVGLFGAESQILALTLSPYTTREKRRDCAVPSWHWNSPPLSAVDSSPLSPLFAWLWLHLVCDIFDL